MPGLLIALLIIGIITLIAAVSVPAKIPWYVPVAILYVILMIQIWPK